MIAFGRNSTGSQQATERSRIEELRDDYYRRVVPTHEPQTRNLPLGLRIVTNADANDVLPLDEIRNQYLGLFVGGEEVRVIRPTLVSATSPFHGVGEQSFERPGAFLHESPTLGRRIPGTEFRAGMPKVVRSDKKNDPVRKQALLAPRGPEVPCVRILD